MAAKVKLSGDVTKISREEMFKAIKAIKGSQSIVGAAEIEKLCKVNKIPTGVPTFDYLGGGGLTEGAISILAGAPSAGKSTLTFMIEAAILEQARQVDDNRMILHFDVERAFDNDYARLLTLDRDGLTIKRVNVIEDAFKEAQDLIATGFFKAMVIDSLDNMVSRKVDESNFGNTMGGTAGALAQHLPVLHGTLIENNITTLIIKQCRVKMNSMGHGEALTFSGGKALRHACDSIYMLKPLSNYKLPYNPVQIKAEKTRSSRIGLTLEMPLSREFAGFDKVRDLVQLCLQVGAIDKGGGGWMTVEGARYQGVDNLLSAVRTNEALRNTLTSILYDHYVNSNSICAVEEGKGMVTDFDDNMEMVSE